MVTTNDKEKNEDAVKPGSGTEEHQQIIKEKMKEALDKYHSKDDNIDDSQNSYKGSDRAEQYEAASQGKSDACEETDVLKNKADK